MGSERRRRAAKIVLDSCGIKVHPRSVNVPFISAVRFKGGIYHDMKVIQLQVFQSWIKMENLSSRWWRSLAHYCLVSINLSFKAL